jgi:c-di-GMP-binding flagellar brake protein YcgR
MSLLDRKYSEKRDFIRMKIDTPAEVTFVEEKISCNGICHDLSGGGMLLTLDREVKLDTELLVTVSTSHGHQPMISARCMVARIEPGPKKSYVLGLEINEVLGLPENEANEAIL